MNIKINKKIFTVYIIFFLFICGFLTYIALYDVKYDTRQQHSAYSVSTWEDYTYKTSLKRTVIAGKLHIDSNTGNLLSFYTMHQNIQVYVNGALKYQYPIKNNNLLSDTPGYSWNFITLPHGSNNVEIIISAPYSSYLDNIPVFYIGNNLSVPSYIISSNIIQFILCIIIFVIGAILVLYHLAISKSVNANGKLLMLGILAIFLSIYSVTECSITTLILKNNIITSYLSFLSIMLLPIPFAVFIKTFYEDNDKIWDIFFQISLAQIFICVVTQLIGLFDLIETLWTSHAVLLLLIVIVMIRSYKILKERINTRTVKINIICISICAISFAIDIFGYYTGNPDSNSFVRVGFLTYIAVLGISSTTESASLMKMGQKASAFQTLAYTDQMTGLNNRTCFNADFERLSHTPEDIAVIDFDLNNLKYTNDTFGHSAGDKYIKNCANIIYEIFNGIGKCYRVGGDEFIAIIEHSSEKDLTHYLAMLESSVDASNRLKENRDLRMQIAYGCAVYSAQTDKNLEDTYNRADKIMYADKEFKKKFSYK